MTDHDDTMSADDLAPVESGRVADLAARLEEAEADLRRLRAKLRLALDLGHLGSLDRDLETGEIVTNLIGKRHFGLAPDAELTADQLKAMYHPADVDRMEQALSYARSTGTDFNIEFRVIRPDGRISHIHSRGAYFYRDKKPVRVASVTIDMTEQEKGRESLEEAQRRQEFLLKLNDQLRSYDDPYAIMVATARSVGQLLKVDTAGYGEVDEDRGVVLIEREWSRGAIGNEGRAYRLHDFLPGMLDEFKQGKPFVVEDTSTDPRTRDPSIQTVYNTINAKAILAAPLLKGGRLTAVLYLTSSIPMIWSSDEIALAEDVAERTWTAVEKARAEISLRETEARFRIIAESLPALVWILTPDFELTYTNERWVRYSGFPAEEALGHSWMAAIHPSDMARIREIMPGIRQNESAFELEARYRSADGEYRWHLIQGEPLHSPLGEFKGWCGTSVDIHELKLTSTALRESEERLSLAQRAAGIGVFDWDIRSGKVTWTAEQERLFGIEPGTFPGNFSGWEDRVLPEDLAASNKVIERAIAERKEEIKMAYRVRMPDGAIRTIDTFALFFYAPDGSPLRMVGVNMDVTRYKQTEERMQLLIRELHHRVKNTLASVQAIVGSTARSASSIEEFYQGFVGRIVSLARTHNLLTEDYWQKASLGDLIRIELGPYDDDAQKRVSVSGPPVELPSEAAVPVGMAIHELTTNAAKHGALSTFGGRVDVEWSVEAKQDHPILHFSWTEHGGPQVGAPMRQGFGSRLLQRVLTTQLNAEVNMDFQGDGLRFTMTMPIPVRPPTFDFGS